MICSVLPGVLVDVKTYYVINDKEASLLSTAFIVSYMLLSPIFGYLGDRFNRTIIMSCGIVSWSAITLASSFVHQQVCLFIMSTLYFCHLLVLSGVVCSALLFCSHLFPS